MLGDDNVCFDVGTLWGERRVNHGDPDNAFVYEFPKDRASCRSLTEKERNSAGVAPAFAKESLELTLAESSPDLMAQFVWQSSITLADRIALGVVPLSGKRVVELGAGAGAPGIAAALSGTAASVTITDYPDEEIVANIKRNVCRSGAECSVEGFCWGKDASGLLERSAAPEGFDVILMADTLWMGDRHDILLQSCSDLLQNTESARIFLAYMHHDHDNTVATSFFEKCKGFGFRTVKTTELAWNDADADSDEEDGDEYGNVFVCEMARSLPGSVERKQ